MRRSGVDALAINVTGALDDEVAAGLDRGAHEELEDGLGLHDLGLVSQCDAPQHTDFETDVSNVVKELSDGLKAV